MSRFHHINRVHSCCWVTHYTDTLLCPDFAILTGCAAAAASYPIYTDALSCPNSVALSGCAAAVASHATPIYCCVPTPPHYKDALLPLHPSSTQHDNGTLLPLPPSGCSNVVYKQPLRLSSIMRMRCYCCIPLTNNSNDTKITH